MAFSIPVGFCDIQLNLAEHHQEVKGSGGSRIGFKQCQLRPVLPRFWQHALGFVHVLGAVPAGSLTHTFHVHTGSQVLPMKNRDALLPVEAPELPARLR